MIVRSRRWLAFLIPIAAVVLLGGFVWLPYYSLGPGPARDVEPLIQVQGHERYPSEGEFVLTSVVFKRLTAFGLIGAWLDPDRVVLSRHDVYPPGQTVEEERARAISQMDQSKLDAAYVALEAVTDYPRDRGEGVLVEGVVTDCAADGELYPGDLIRSIDGAPVNSVREASRAIGAAPSGTRLIFDVTVDGEPETIRLLREPCGGDKEPLVGVSLINAFPFEISISSAGIGGPSAGLMWALGLYDLLTPGDLAEGRTIAGTGEIGIDGTVYPIGGIEEKLVAAAHAGAEVFLVPRDNAKAARAAGDQGMELVEIATFDDALAYLQGAG